MFLTVLSVRTFISLKRMDNASLTARLHLGDRIRAPSRGRARRHRRRRTPTEPQPLSALTGPSRLRDRRVRARRPRCRRGVHVCPDSARAPRRAPCLTRTTSAACAGFVGPRLASSPARIARTTKTTKLTRAPQGRVFTYVLYFIPKHNQQQQQQQTTRRHRLLLHTTKQL